MEVSHSMLFFLDAEKHGVALALLGLASSLIPDCVLSLLSSACPFPGAVLGKCNPTMDSLL